MSGTAPEGRWNPTAQRRAAEVAAMWIGERRPLWHTVPKHGAQAALPAPEADQGAEAAGLAIAGPAITRE